MQYEDFQINTKEGVNQLLLTKHPDSVIKGLLGAVNGVHDYEWVQSLCLSYCLHDDYWIAKTAINLIGDISRVYGKINLELVYNAFEKINDKNLIEEINQTKEDITIFVKGKST